LNTLFVRTILLSMAVLFAVRAGVMLLVCTSAAGDDNGAQQTAVSSERAFTDDQLALFAGEPPPMVPSTRVSLVPAAMKLDLVARPRIVDFRSAVYEAPSAGTFVNFAEPLPSASPSRAQGGRFHDEWSWTDAAAASPADPRIAFAEWSAALAMLALAFFGIWHLHRPLRNVTRAARASASGGCLATAIREEGPGELRRVVRAFNEMLRRRNDALEAQAAALAGLAQHMEYQAARLRTRALEVTEWHKRVAFVEDIDSFTDIAQQLLEVAGRGTAAGQVVSVDGFLRDRFSMIGTMDGALFACDLKAGPQFVMSRPLLERLMSNLVDNALEHGEPPIEIRTSRDQSGWLLTVRDHGAGIHESELATATKPFVRLSATQRTSQHWGLGLAVVARLARRCGASLELRNHPDGGLCVRLVLPAA
jgi:two-component system osmolarity sensor histidine kinase EnvZ